MEDDDGDAKAVVRTFEKARIANRIVRALDGIEAMDILKGSGKQPKLPAPHMLLVDLNMPRMDRDSTGEGDPSRSRLHDTIIFMLTTSNRADDKRRPIG